MSIERLAMMKKKLMCFVLSASLLTGCSASSDKFLTYDSNVTAVGSNLINQDNVNTDDLFARNLCVIPLKTDVSEDGNLTGEATLLVNKTTNEMLYAKNVYKRLYPASLTKLATALVVLKNSDLSDVVTVSKEAAGITEAGAKLCGLKEGDKIVLKDLLTSLLVYSGNDAGTAIADHIAGTEKAFADLMNEEVKKLGATHSHFVNAHGLHDEEHYTTAYDLYLIFNELLNYDDFLNIIKLGEYKLDYTDASGAQKSKTFMSTDRFMNGQMDAPKGITVLGGKTGTTNKAGSCLMLASKDKKENMYISLILKTDSGDMLFSQMAYLLKLILK